MSKTIREPAMAETISGNLEAAESLHGRWRKIRKVVKLLTNGGIFGSVAIMALELTRLGIEGSKVAGALSVVAAILSSLGLFRAYSKEKAVGAKVDDILKSSFSELESILSTHKQKDAAVRVLNQLTSSRGDRVALSIAELSRRTEVRDEALQSLVDRLSDLGVVVVKDGEEQEYMLSHDVVARYVSKTRRSLFQGRA